jgi:copper(I)-binding protein
LPREPFFENLPMKKLTVPLIAWIAMMPFAAVPAQDAAPVKTGTDARSPSVQLPKVQGAWVRAAVPGQSGTGAFMKLTAPQAMQLVGVTTPVAAAAEVHEMKMEGDVMRMRPVTQIDLPAGRTVELKPGGYHLMLMDLKQTLKAGTTVPLTLVFRDAQGAERKLELKVAVALQAPGARASTKDAQEHMHKH